jgi:hypothetical protein
MMFTMRMRIHISIYLWNNWLNIFLNLKPFNLQRIRNSYQ